MVLKNQIFDLCNKLAQNGWREMILLATNNQLDIKQDSADKLREALLIAINNVDREFPGFEDFTFEDNKGISPRKPASSLLYHSLASPNVLWKNKQKIEKLNYFPTLEEIELVENYVFGITPPSLSLLLSEADSNEIAIVVFASQYRTAIDTPHQKHADLVFSRTGISRVGTANLLYNNENRSFESLVESDPHKLRVLPSKFNAYLSVKVKGDEKFLGKKIRKDHSLDIIENIPIDTQLDFWIPIHKLFTSDECISNKQLNIKFDIKFKNEKIKKIHKFIKNEFSLETSQQTDNLEGTPFVLQENIAQLDALSNLLIPHVHNKLVEEAIFSDKNISLQKPALPVIKNDNTLKLFSSSLEIRSKEVREGGNNSRPAPEYMHIRSKVEKNGQISNLNLKEDIINEISSPTYNALHYLDFTGDGFVKAIVEGLSAINKNIIAYAIVAAPDFFPFVEQSEILNKTLQDLDGIWAIPPLVLSDTRISPNINSHPEFKANNGLNTFDTITALISIKKSDRKITNFQDTKENRTSYLTDGAAGIFAPGWDTGWDVNIFEGKAFPHLAAYGLGSPFPEDSKLCAALSSFWPAVAPDISRSFWPTSITTLPLTDEEIGANSLKSGWDGEFGPKYDRKNKKVVFKKMDYVDYTLNAFNNQFNFHLLKNIDAEEYLNRVRVYFKLRKIDKDIQKIDSKGNKSKLLELVSFIKVNINDSEVKNLKDVLNIQLSEPVLKFIFIKPSQQRKNIGTNEIEVTVENEIIYLVDTNGIVAKKSLDTTWDIINI